MIVNILQNTLLETRILLSKTIDFYYFKTAFSICFMLEINKWCFKSELAQNN